MKKNEGIKTLAEKMIGLIGRMDQELGEQQLEPKVQHPTNNKGNREKVHEKD